MIRGTYIINNVAKLWSDRSFSIAIQYIVPFLVGFVRRRMREEVWNQQVEEGVTISECGLHPTTVVDVI